MPPKKRTNLRQKTKNAQRLKRKREEETEEETKNRLAQNQLYVSASRLQSVSFREIRLENLVSTTKRMRMTRTETKYAVQLQRQRDRTEIGRSEETEEEYV